MNDIKKEFFTSKFLNLNETDESKRTYNILPEYGDGKITIYEIIQGMYLTLNEFELYNRIINNTNRQFLSPMIELDYCIDGSYICNCSDEKVCFVNKGSTTYYVGMDYYDDVDFKGKRYESICVFCYLDDMTNSIEQFLGVSKDKIERYYNILNSRKDVLIIETDIEILKKINEIYEYIRCDNIEMIKIRAIELFLLEMNNYEEYKNRKEKYYKRSTIDKIRFIKDYIEENIQEHVTIHDLSSRFDISATELKDCFKYVYGMGPYTYLKNFRMQTASKLLENNDYNIMEIANIVGYLNQSKFSAAFKKTFGATPFKYKKMQ